MMAAKSSASVQVDLILKEFEKMWTFDSRDLARPSAESVLQKLVHDISGENSERLSREFFGLGPLSELVSDTAVTEIIVNGATEIWYERAGALHQSVDNFLSESTFINFIERFCSEAHIKVDLAQPFADGRWQDFRAHLTLAPLVHCSYHLTLRRIPTHPWTLFGLLEHCWCTANQMKLLQTLIEQRKNMLLVGPTGCGKTSVLGAILKEIPAHERAVICEDTDELPRPNGVSTKMLTRSLANAALADVTLTDLVRQSLRMRPQRLVMGEVRGGEAKDLLLALATGHSGSLGTLHASEARQALLRLEMLVQLGAPQWNTQAIRQLILLSLDNLVVCGFAQNGTRSLQGIYKIAALESFGFLLEPLTDQ